MHEGHKDHKHKFCSKSFSESGNLKKHIYRIHEGHKYYKCRSCGKSFSEEGCLKKHIYRIHEGHKDYKCELCGKSFSKAKILKKHIRTVHEGFKCGKSFSCKSNLTMHKHKYEGHKEYKCEFCGKAFSQSGHVKSHIHTIHKVNKNEGQKTLSNSESHEMNKIKNDLDLDGIPIFESDLDKGIKEEFVPQSIDDFRDVEGDIKVEESKIEEMPNFEMDSNYLGTQIEEKIKLEPLF